MNLNIQEHLDKVANDSINLIEIYLCEKPIELDNIINVKWQNKIKLPNGLIKLSTQTLHEYDYQDMTYSYDIADDAQLVVSKRLFSEGVNNSESKSINTYILLYKEDILPSHRFPCTTDIHAKRVIEKTTYRINNRMVLIVENGNVVYIKYKHDSNVDITKIQKDLDNFLNKL